MKMKLFAMLFFAVVSANLMAQDIVDVPPLDDADDPNLVKFILGDTTETGQRANPERIYRLQRGAVYVMDGALRVDFNLSIIADDDDPANPTSPPMIVRGKYADGVNIRDPFQFIGDNTNIYFKNILFQGLDLDRRNNDWTGPGKIKSDYTRVTYENCIFNEWEWVLYSVGEHNSIYVRDCIFRNSEVTWHPFVGQGVVIDGYPLDTLVVTNCTSFNNNSFWIYVVGEIANYVHIEHNTIVGNLVDILRTPHLTNAKILDNLFFATHAMGHGDYEIAAGWYSSDGTLGSTINIDTVDVGLIENAGLTEADRRILVANNAYFWPREVRDFWAASDTLYGVTWMNDRTRAMFDDDANYPYLTAENNVEADPNFTDAVMEQWLVEQIVDWARKYRDPAASPSPRNYDAYVNGGEIFFLPWPLPESMVYENEALLTGGHDGLPVGDLHWFPEKKAEWEDMQTSVEFASQKQKPAELELLQNYPNPFNPSTTIHYQLYRPGHATLDVISITGRVVATLVDRHQNAGRYSIEFDAKSLASGVYLYRLKSNDQTVIKRMLLVR